MRGTDGSVSGDLGVGRLELANIARSYDRARVSGLICGGNVEVDSEVAFGLELTRNGWAGIVARTLGLVARSSRYTAADRAAP